MPTRVYIPTEPYTPTGESMYAQPAPDNALLAAPEQQSALSRGINRLLGTQFGEERYQTWPEKMIRSAATLAGDVVSGAVPVLPPGSRREDFTDEPAPGVDSNAPWWKVSRWVPPVAAQPNDVMMERAQDLAGVAMGGGIGGTGKAAAAGEAVLGSGPIMVVARKMPTGELKTGKPGQIHSDLLTDAELIAGVNTAPGEMGFALPDGRYLTRNQALEHALKNEPERAYDANAKGRGLEAVKYNEEPVAAGGKTLRSGMGDEGAGPVPLNQKGPPWFSAVEHALEQSTTGSAPGAQWLATLRNARGVKPEEMAWLGLDDMLAEAQLAGRKVTRAEIQDHIKSHQVELRDVEKGGQGHDPDTVWETATEQIRNENPDLDPSSGRFEALADKRANELEAGPPPTKYHDYQLPGGENYREHLITMPNRKAIEAEAKLRDPNRDLRAAEMSRLLEDHRSDYKSSHWDEPNILAHVRTNDRVIDGRKSLHLEEVQSDWHQQGRDKGYKTGERPATSQEIEQGLARTNRDGELVMGAHGVPDAPFKKTWHELALKRMLRRAAEEGYERLSWTPGDAQAARYGLSKTFSDVLTTRKKDGSFIIAGKRSGRDKYEPLALDVSQEKLMDYVGKELASKIAKDYEAVPADAFPVQQQKSYSGVDLKIGGEGMRGFYDQILPKALEKIGREHGVKVQRGEVKIGEHPDYADTAPIFYIDIPQSLRDAAMRRGFPLFSGGKMFVPHQEEDK